jgi:uncharacterized protein YjiS (DUF1127 family)
MEIDRMTIELVRWIRERAGEEIRYRRTLRELRRIDERTLDDLALGRADLPEIARRHRRRRRLTVRPQAAVSPAIAARADAKRPVTFKVAGRFPVHRRPLG